jgi:DNA polymerase III subunit epsilon
MEPIAVIDFETTGLAPSEGARATEVAAVIIQNGKVVSRYQSLMNAGVQVPGFITNLTGITNTMVQTAPTARQVMDELCKFLGPLALVAHNASFDKKFFENECRLAGINHDGQFACSMLIARRLFPDSPNHKLGTLVNYLKIRKTGQFHRALSDAEMTAQLTMAIHKKFSDDYGVTSPSHAMLRKLQRTKYADVDKTLRGFSKSQKPMNKSTEGTLPPKEFIRSDLSKERQQHQSPQSQPTPKPVASTPVSIPAQKEKSEFPIFWVVVAAAVLLFMFSD